MQATGASIKKTESSGKGTFTDEVLWKSFKNGNELALSLLYNKYVQPLYNYGMHSFHDHNLVMDGMQELFLRLWGTRSNLADIHYVKPYLFKSLRRFLIHQVVKNKKNYFNSVEESKAFDFMPSIETVLIEEETNSERSLQLKKCIQSLTKSQREIIFLKFYSDLSYLEIAEITDLQVDSVYNLVSKTIQLLRKKLQVTVPFIS